MLFILVKTIKIVVFFLKVIYMYFAMLFNSLGKILEKSYLWMNVTNLKQSGDHFIIIYWIYKIEKYKIKKEKRKPHIGQYFFKAYLKNQKIVPIIFIFIKCLNLNINISKAHIKFSFTFSIILMFFKFFIEKNRFIKIILLILDFIREHLQICFLSDS